LILKEHAKMSKAIHRESPLVRFARQRQAATPAPANGGVTASERAFCGHLNLRGDPASPEFVAAARSVLGCALPLAPNTVAYSGHCTVFWLGPNEWLIVVPDGAATAMMAELQRALHGQFVAVTDVSGGQTIVVLRGEQVRELLAKGCPLDFHPRAFGPGRCAQSHLAKAPILLHQLDHAPTFELIMRRSFADYLWHWLRDAADEFGFDVVASAPAARPLPSSVDVPLLAVNA
jgi:sarcosine oxidase, subunit gamma